MVFHFGMPAYAEDQMQGHTKIENLQLCMPVHAARSAS